MRTMQSMETLEREGRGLTPGGKTTQLPAYDLTPHELRLLRLLVDGHSYKTMARLLSVTVHAVSFHVRHIYEKLGVHSKSEAAGKALRQHLVD